MKFKSIAKTIFTIFFLVIAHINTANAVSANLTKNTLKIGGNSDVLFISDTTAFASATGTFAALTATIISFNPQSDGSIIFVSIHTFKTEDNGYLSTKDKTTLLPIAGKPGVYLGTTKYVIQDSGDGLEGFAGQFFTGNSLINFNDNTANVRYEGKISRHTWVKKIPKPVFRNYNLNLAQ